MSEQPQKKSTSEEGRRAPTSQAKPDASSALAQDRLAKAFFDSTIEDTKGPIDTTVFQLKLLGGLIQDCYKFQPNNIDFWRSEMGRPGRLKGMPARIKQRLEDRVLLLASRGGFIRRPPVNKVAKRLVRALRNIDRLERFYHF